MLKARKQAWQTPGICILQRSRQTVARQAKQESGAPRLAGSAQGVQRLLAKLDTQG